MATCKSCGYVLKDNMAFCPECGKSVETAPAPQTVETVQAVPEKESASEQFNEFKDSAMEMGEKAFSAASVFGAKALDGAKNLANQASKAVEEKRDNYRAEIEQQGKRTEVHKTVVARQEYMADDQLWSWLKKDSKRQLFFTEEPLELEEPEFMSALQGKMNENGVPAEIVQRPITWDRNSATTTNSYLVRPRTEEVNPLSCMVQFKKVGKYSFVEEKTFITPPNLPEIPGKILTSSVKPNQVATTFIVGLIALIAGFMALGIRGVGQFGILFIIAGFLVLGYGAWSFMKYNEVEKHNKKVRDQVAAWDLAWSNWEDAIFVHSFLEDINGQVSRVFEAVFDCVKQTSAELIKVEPSGEEADAQKMNELEEMMRRRKDDYR